MSRTQPKQHSRSEATHPNHFASAKREGRPAAEYRDVAEAT